MSIRLLAISAAVCVALALGTAWIFELPLERATVLAPVIVLVVGAAAALVVLWVRVGYESLRRARNPRRVLAIVLAFLAVLAALTVLGVQLPRE